AFAMALACAAITERYMLPARHVTTSCDLLAAVGDQSALPERVRRVAREIPVRAREALGDRAVDRVDDEAVRRAVLAGYPDRVARRRAQGSDRFLLASGAGARLAQESGVRDAEFIVAVDVGRTDAAGADSLIRIASGIEREWLTPSTSTVEHELDSSGAVRAWRIERYDAIELVRHPVTPDPERAAELVASELIR